MQLIECVPNISEGCSQSIIAELGNVISKVDGVKLLNTDIGVDANRTVFTFIGFPKSVIEAAFQLFKRANQLISMENHHGKHPRIGVVDVCPLIPIQGITLEETAEFAEELAKRVGEELHIPIYLYEENAKNEYRSRLEQIRAGEYEGFKQKILLDDWKPDFGPQTFNKKTGVSVIGARNFLLAYNINLETKDVNIAKNIAAQIRESGGTFIDNQGNKKRSEGLLKGVKAIGWYIQEFDMVQVSTNITDYNKVSMFEVFTEVSKFAKMYGTTVRGSELIGLVPFDALFRSGTEIKQQDSSLIGESIDIAIAYLKLDDIKECIPQKQILEYAAGIM